MVLTSETDSRKNVFLYALSTCVMCKAVKRLLADLEVEYDFVDVDQLPAVDKATAKREMRKWDRRGPFPMLIVNKSVCVIGDEPEAIRKALDR